MSWKKYGGIKELNKSNFINTNSLTTDTLTLREAYDGNFKIKGSLDVNENTDISGNLDVNGDLNVIGDVTFQGDIKPNNVFVNTLLDVSGICKFKDYIYFDDSQNVFLYGSGPNVGINNTGPVYLLDICGNQEQMFRVISTKDSVESILSQNKNNRKIVVNVDNSQNKLSFFHSDLSSAFIQFDPANGILKQDVSYGIFLRTQKLFVKNDTSIDKTDEATVIFHDNVITPSVFLPHIDISSTTTTGTNLKLVSSDTSSNTFLKIVNTDDKGWNFGGGVFPFDTNRSMGSIGWTDMCSNNYAFSDNRYIPSQTIISGNSLINSRATTGFNTYHPKTEDYVVDINGSLKITHNEIHDTADMPFELNQISFSTLDKFSVAVGQIYNTTNNSIYLYKLLYSYNYGKSWNVFDVSINDIDLVLNTYTYNTNIGLIYSTNDQLYFFNDKLFKPIILTSDANFGTIRNNRVKRFFYDVSGIKYSIFSFYDGGTLYVHDISNTVFNNIEAYQNEDISIYININIQPTNTTTDLHFEYIQAIDGNRIINSNITFYLAGSNKLNEINQGLIFSYTHANGTLIANPKKLIYTNSNISAYNSIKLYNNNTIISVGGNYITTVNILNDSENNVIDYSLNNIDIYLNDVFILDSYNAIVVGNNAEIYYSTNYKSKIWNKLTSDMVDSMGNASSLLNPINDIKTVHMDESYNFIFGCVVNKRTVSDFGKSKIFYCYFPTLFNKDYSKSVVDIVGNMNIDGLLYCNNNMKIAPTSSSISIGNSNSTVNIGKLDSSGLYLNSNKIPISIVNTSSRLYNGKNYTKSFTIGDNDTVIDINGYLNLLNNQNTNIIGIGGGGGGLNYDQVTSQVNMILTDFSHSNIRSTSQKEFHVNYKSAYDTNTETAGSGLYIYNDILNNNGISVDGQLSSGYVRISKYKIGNLKAQDSFSLKSTGSDQSLRLNIPKITTNPMENKNPLLFVRKLDIRNESEYINTNINFNDDHAEMLASNTTPYIDDSGNMYTNNKDFSTKNINITGLLYATDSSFNGNVVIYKDLSLNGRLYTALDSTICGNVVISKDLSLNGRLYTALDSTMNGNLVISKDLSLNGRLLAASDSAVYGNLVIAKDLSLNGRLLAASDSTMSGNLVIAKDLSLNGRFYTALDSTMNGNLVIAKDLSLNGRCYTALDSTMNGNLVIAKDLSLNGRLYARDCSFNGNVFLKSIEFSGISTSSIELLRSSLSIADTGGSAGRFDSIRVTNDCSFNGNVLIGKDLYLNGRLYAIDGSFNGNLFCTSVSAILFNATSDYRIKNDVKQLDDKFSVDYLKPVTYFNNKLQKQDIGFLAHEVQEKYPFMVSGVKDGKDMQTLNYNALIGILVKEIQDLKKEIIAMKENIVVLENKLI